MPKRARRNSLPTGKTETILETILSPKHNKGVTACRCNPLLLWRRDRDSNPRYLAVHLISSQAPSTTRTSLRCKCVYLRGIRFLLFSRRAKCVLLSTKLWLPMQGFRDFPQRFSRPLFLRTQFNPAKRPPHPAPTDRDRPRNRTPDYWPTSEAACAHAGR